MAPAESARQDGDLPPPTAIIATSFHGRQSKPLCALEPDRRGGRKENDPAISPLERRHGRPDLR